MFDGFVSTYLYLYLFGHFIAVDFKTNKRLNKVKKRS